MTTALAPAPQPPGLRPAAFDLRAYLAGFRVDALVKSAEYRRAISRVDPLAFALTYLPHHLRGEETGGQITFSEFHLDLVAQARRWVLADTEPAQHRDAYVAPRNCGKSTWLFLILPLWAAAHGHRKFIAAFADSAAQAEMHLASFKHELDTNKLLRNDFPLLCQPARRPTGTVKADRSSMLVTKAGFTFAAKGIDSASLGMKVDEKRPDLLILDDIEPDEANYSAYQKEKRERTLIDAILPLNVFARVVLVGTVTMPGSLIHDLVKTKTQPGDEPAEWVQSENFVCHYYPAILDNGDGTERSIWPDKWSLEYLCSIRHTRAFRKNMQNDPMAADGVYWNDEDFRYGLPEPLTGQLLSIDPAVTSKKKSDFTALAIVGHSAVKRQCVVRYARTYKVQPGEQLREIVLRTLAAYPETVGVVVESNQGGDTWKAILHDLPVKLSTVHQSIPKEIRAADLLNLYQRGRVLHEQRLPAAEEQMVSFPKGPNDDIVDAIGTGVAKFMGKKRSVSVTNVNYLGDD